ncbi:MAG: SOS response-associated peptidase [Methanoregula sp.]|nr:SOS response-associated peptidase [Methanoregula sp.]
MCGRYSLICIDDLGNRFRIFNPMLGARSKFNIAPGTRQPVIVQGTGGRELVQMQWGLVSRGTKTLTGTHPIINARAESLLEKSLFASLVKTKRCLVPASGFFEWKHEGTRKQPFYLHLTDQPLFAFAGLYDVWHDPAGAIIVTYTIITTGPNALVTPIHNRMPVILSPDYEEQWLAGSQPDVGLLREMLAPYPAEQMAMHPVSPLVNTPSADDERVIRPVVSLDGEYTQ